MAAVSVGPSLNSRLSGTDALRLKNVTFSEDLPHLRLHHTVARGRVAACRRGVPGAARVINAHSEAENGTDGWAPERPEI